jgi:hypothetical protein
VYDSDLPQASQALTKFGGERRLSRPTWPVNRNQRKAAPQPLRDGQDHPIYLLICAHRRILARVLKVCRASALL